MYFDRKPISLISHSDVRYRGILAGIDPHASTIQLSNGEFPTSLHGFKWCRSPASVVLNLCFFFSASSVFYGNRDATVRLWLDSFDPVDNPIYRCHNSPPDQYIPPIQEPYQYIIFRASEVKDLSVDDPVQAPPRRTHDDPAILAVSRGFFQSNVAVSFSEHNFSR